MARSFEFVVCLLVLGVTGSKDVLRYSVGGEFESMVEGMVNGDFDSRSSFIHLFLHGERPVQATRLYGFSYSNCGSPKTDPQLLKSLSLSPNPLRVPGQIMVSFEAGVTKSLTSPIKVSVTLEKKIVFWIKVPCMHGVGSCTYNDVCSMITSCPEVFKQQGIPCECPVKPGQYKLTNGAFNVQTRVPAGDYRMTARFSNNGVSVGCYKLNFSFK